MNGMRSMTALRPRITAKKNRSAVTVAFRLGAATPLDARCS
jgi:hypothetical protein